ncbi:hypothetical protein G4W71_09075 [Clostridium botulinum]|uniref:hypothetical protein n=1 Tax=Clostridium botulinum TaxID=1491 RepID=UPI001788AD21|nr:hypothetical protein [Clostridium botulinum]MBE1304170.1 hypothetical protein [Clostridium botulinum]
MDKSMNIKNDDVHKNRNNYPRFIKWIEKIKSENFIIENISYPDGSNWIDIWEEEQFNYSIRNYQYSNSYIEIKVNGHYREKYPINYVPKLGDQVLYAVNSGTYNDKYLSIGVINKLDDYKAKIDESWVYHAKLFPSNLLKNKEIGIEELKIGDKIVSVVQYKFMISDVVKKTKQSITTNYGTRVKNGEFYKLKEEIQDAW